MADADQNNIRIILSDKAELFLEEIINAFNLQDDDRDQDESPNIIIDQLIKDYAKGTMSEKNFIASLQNDLKIPLETAEKMSKEIINKIVPLLEKIPEEKFNDPDFREEISKKIFGEEKMEIENESANIFQKIKPPISVAEALNKNNIKIPEIKTETATESAPAKTTKKTAQPIQQEKPKRSGPDNYREPIE